MICVMSVMNGFGSVIEGMFSEFDPELKICPASGKVMRLDAPELQTLHQMAEIDAISSSLEEVTLVRYGDHQSPARVLGVDTRWQQVTHIDSVMVAGSFSMHDGTYARAVLGRGLANTMSLNENMQQPLLLFAPKREGRINMLRPDQSFREQAAYVSGIFAVGQIKYDDELIIVSIEQAQTLLGYDSQTVSSLNLKLTPTAHTAEVQKTLRAQLGSGYQVLDRYEQQADFFRILRIEKLLTVLLLSFILLIASFNIISSLTMLIIDKRADIRTLSALGADDRQIRQVFLLEGWMISSLGALIGLALGVVLCLIQQHYGLIKLGSGEDYILSAYPVVVHGLDICITALVVLLLGFIAAWYPTRKITTYSTSTAL